MNSYRFESGKSDAEILRHKRRDAKFRLAGHMRGKWSEQEIQNEEQRLADEVTAILKLRSEPQEQTQDEKL